MIEIHIEGGLVQFVTDSLDNSEEIPFQVFDWDLVGEANSLYPHEAIKYIQYIVNHPKMLNEEMVTETIKIINSVDWGE